MLQHYEVAAEVRVLWQVGLGGGLGLLEVTRTDTRTHVGHLALPKQLILMLSKDPHEKAKLKYDSEEDNDCIIYVMNIFPYYFL